MEDITFLHYNRLVLFKGHRSLTHNSNIGKRFRDISRRVREYRRGAARESRRRKDIRSSAGWKYSEYSYSSAWYYRVSPAFSLPTDSISRDTLELERNRICSPVEGDEESPVQRSETVLRS